ncbi:MAG: RDD family protein [Proteobacteria bacterium]|nr:RDD family protein [Pseudomonadota bacterium]
MHYAGFWKRLFAGLLDNFILYMGIAFTFFVLGKPITPENGGFSNITNINFSGSWLFFGWIYFASFQSSKFQATPGMMFFSLRIEDYQKRRISFWRATGRLLASYLSSLLFCLGYIMIAFTPRKQALHDYIARTLVVKN